MDYNRPMDTPVPEKSTRLREVDRAGKEAYAAYLSLSRAREALERAVLSGPPDGTDAEDALEGRLEQVRKGLVRARAGYPPAAGVLPDAPAGFDGSALSVALESVSSLLEAMKADGLGKIPTSIRYLQDDERDHTVLTKAIEALAAVDAGHCTLGLFGSVARGENGPESDIDILIRSDTSLPIEEEARLADAAGAALASLGMEVDVVLERDLTPEYRPSVLAELVTLEAGAHAV